MAHGGTAAAVATRRRRRAGAAALLPATLFAAVLVAAPFAGTTTHPLAAGRNAAAVVTTAAHPSTTVPAAGPTAGSAGSTRAIPADAPAPVHVVVPRSSVRTLVLSYVLIMLIGVAVIVVAAARVSRRGRRDAYPRP